MAKKTTAADVKTGDDVPLNPNGTEKQNHKPFLERSKHAQDQENISPVELAKLRSEAGDYDENKLTGEKTDPLTGKPVEEDK